MANRLEVARDYLVSVAERIAGINAYRRWQGYIDPLDNPPTDLMTDFIRVDRRYTGIFLGVVQFVMPASTDAIARMWEEGAIKRKKENPWITMAKYNTYLPMMDVAILSLLVTSPHDSPLELVAWKLAANAATHVGLDLGNAAINRFKSAFLTFLINSL